MSRLFVESIPIHSIWYSNGVLKLDYYIGPRRIKLGEPVEVFFKYYPQTFLRKEVACREVLFYIIYYPGFYKLGSSSWERVVSRVYSQAPLISIINLAIEACDTDLEIFEKNCAEHIRQELGLNIFSRRSAEYGYENVFVNYIKSLVNNSISNNSSLVKNVEESLIKASNYMYNYIDVYYRDKLTILYKPFNYILKTEVSKRDIEVLSEILDGGYEVFFNTRVLEKECRNKWCIGELIILRNSICIVRKSKINVITTCDRVQYDLLFKIRR